MLRIALGTHLPDTLAFDYPTPEAVVDFIMALAAPPSTASAASAVAPDAAAVQASVLRCLQAVTGAAEVSTDAPLLSSGLDSISSMEFRGELGRAFGMELPSTLVFDYPSVASITSFVCSLQTIQPATKDDCFSGHLSVVGAPGDRHVASDDVRTAAAMVIEAVERRLPVLLSAATPASALQPDICNPTPFSRWDVDAGPPQRHRPGSRFGRFFPDADLFDAVAFGISASEALLVDPQQRMMLEDAAAALAGWGAAAGSPPPPPDSLAVLASQSFWDYAQATDRAIPWVGEAYKATGRCFSVAAGRISFCLGLKGASLSVDTACSSSLSATHLLHRMLLDGRCGGGLVAAALLTLDPATIGMLTAAAMLSPDGRCKTMDAAADGYVRGEGCVAFAARLADPAALTGALAVVAGTAINQDGRSSSLTAPNGPSQQAVVRLALQDAAVAPARIVGLEMHGTGTSLGDPIEVGAALAVFGPSAGQREQPLELSAAKSCLGHTEPAAGAAGICHALYRLGTGCAPGILHLSAVNPYIVGSMQAASGLATFMPRGPSAAGLGGLGGVSGFAFQGTNAHIVLER
jgi:3-oxoacyl-(acyl-carrier-protein) synthase/acyl carrier protein